MSRSQKPPAPRAPRNPLVAAALFRKAGAHQRSKSGERQLAQQALRQAVQRAWRRDDG